MKKFILLLVSFFLIGCAGNSSRPSELLANIKANCELQGLRESSAEMAKVLLERALKEINMHVTEGNAEAIAKMMAEHGRLSANAKGFLSCVINQLSGPITVDPIERPITVDPIER